MQSIFSQFWVFSLSCINQNSLSKIFFLRNIFCFWIIYIFWGSQSNAVNSWFVQEAYMHIYSLYKCNINKLWFFFTPQTSVYNQTLKIQDSSETLVLTGYNYLDVSLPVLTKNLGQVTAPPAVPYLNQDSQCCTVLLDAEVNQLLAKPSR